MAETLADKVISAMTIISEVERMLADVNDFGEVTGFCQEHMDITEDAHAFFGILRRRAYTLKNRIERSKKSDKRIVFERVSLDEYNNVE